MGRPDTGVRTPGMGIRHSPPSIPCGEGGTLIINQLIVEINKILAEMQLISRHQWDRKSVLIRELSLFDGLNWGKERLMCPHFRGVLLREGFHCRQDSL